MVIEVCLMNSRELKFQQCRKETSESQDSSRSSLRRACVSLVSPLCSGGAVSTSSMADPASLPLAAVSVSASNSRHSTRKRIIPTQPEKTEAKRPRTRSQDTGAFNENSTEKTSKKGKHKQSTSFESSITRSSLRNSKPNDKTIKIHNNHQITPNIPKKASVSLTETGNIDLHRKNSGKRPQSAGCTNTEDNIEPFTKTKKSFKIEPGTSRWNLVTNKKSSKKIKESRSLDADSSIHKYPLRSQVRLSGTETFDKTTEEQTDHKAIATNKKKHKVRIDQNLWLCTKLFNHPRIYVIETDQYSIITPKTIDLHEIFPIS